MQDHTTFVYSIESMDDLVRANLIYDLDATFHRTDPEHIESMETAPPFIGESRPITCRPARLKLRHLPGWVVAWEDDSRLADAQEHARDCAACRDWATAGMPFRFDFSWDTDREAFCKCVQRTLHHEDDWPASYQAALAHSARCARCRLWPEHIMKHRSCEGARALARSCISLPAYAENDEPSALTDKHFALCAKCRDWCFGAIPCREVRSLITNVMYQNNREWMTWRHRTLGPLARNHLQLCEGCRMWFYDDVERSPAAQPIRQILAGPTEPDRDSAAWSKTLSVASGRAMGYITAQVIDERLANAAEQGGPIDIDNVGFSVRTLNCLKKAGCRTLADVSTRSDAELSAIRNFGKRSLREIHDVLEAHGLRRRQECAANEDDLSLE